MNKKEFIEVMYPVAQYYDRKLSDELVKMYYALVKQLSKQTLEALTLKHMQDPDHGQFFPTFAHLTNQAANEKGLKRQAGLEFDDNPGIDGSGHWEVNHETTFQRQERRRRYIDNKLERFHSQNAIERIQTSNILEHQDVKRLGVIQ